MPKDEDRDYKLYPVSGTKTVAVPLATVVAVVVYFLHPYISKDVSDQEKAERTCSLATCDDYRKRIAALEADIEYLKRVKADKQSYPPSPLRQRVIALEFCAMKVCEDYKSPTQLWKLPDQ